MSKTKFTVHFNQDTLDKVRDTVYYFQQNSRVLERRPELRNISALVDKAVLQYIEGVRMLHGVGPIEALPVNAQIKRGRPRTQKD